MFSDSGYEGKRLNFGERASKENLREESELWKDSIFFEIEQKAIENFFETCVEEKKRGDTQNENCKCGKMIETIKVYLPRGEDARTLRELKDIYGNDLDLKKLYDKLHPTRWLIGFILAVILETSVLVVQALGSGGFNPVILLFAGMLAMGGWVLGYGSGGLFGIYKLKKMGLNTNKESSNKPIFITSVIVGIIIIVFVAVVRSLGDEVFYFETFFLTVILGGLVSLLEALREVDSLTKKHVIDDRIKLLKIKASELHEGNMKNYLEKIPEECKEEMKNDNSLKKFLQ